jgi:iron(III) transport system ATP-binding protein
MGRGAVTSGAVEPAARLLGVTKVFRGARAVDGVTFDVAAGELVTLLGPSGCGKTTTLRSIAGLEKIGGGEIFVNDRLVSSVPRGVHVSPEKRDVGMVFQSYALWPHMTVFENVAYPLVCRKFDKAEIRRRVAEGLALVGMETFEDRPATQLSGGQQQRVGLARAIVMEPSVLLLDEPLSNLDAKLRVQMRAHIKRLQRQTGLTMIYVTHDQSEAMALSDRVIVMNAGVIEQIGSPEDVYERPRTQFVADFVGATNFVPGTVTAVDPVLRLLSISTGTQTIVAAWEDDVPPVGSEALLMIRPERLTVHAGDEAAAPGSANALAGKVASNVYCGDHRELRIEIADGSLRVSAPSSVRAVPGTSVSVCFAARDVRLFPQVGVRPEGGAPEASRGLATVP